MFICHNVHMEIIMLNCEIEILKNLTEKELHKYFGSYISGAIALFGIIVLYVILHSVLSTVTLSPTARLFILITAFAIAIITWIFNLLLARLYCNKRLISG